MLSKNRARAYLRCLFIPVPDRHLSRDLLSVLEHSGHLLERCDRYDAGQPVLLAARANHRELPDHLPESGDLERHQDHRRGPSSGRRIHLLHHALAYPLSKRNLLGWKYFSFFFVFTMYFGGGLIPTYMIIKSLGLIDSFWVYIFPGLIGVFLMILVRTFMEQIPGEIEESSKIDGANDLQTFFRIIMPLCVPVLATIGLFLAIGHWNSWYDSMCIPTSRSSRPCRRFWSKSSTSSRQPA